MSPYKPTSPKLFFSKNDPNDLRLGDLVKCAEPAELIDPDTFCVLGYPDEEGIKLNKGRLGAASGPDSIRHFLYKMTPPFIKNNLFDIGNLGTDQELAVRHEIAQTTMCKLQQNKIKTISLGGGHDYGYPDASGFLKAHLSSIQAQNTRRPLVLNFDAHLDVRPTTNGLNSGTPFYRLLTEYEDRFDFAEIGIQPQCNSIQHREWALNKKAHVFNLKDIQKNDGLNSLFEHPLFAGLTKSTPLFVSFDIDCLSSTEAPGCSQSWVTGLHTEDFLKFFLKLTNLADVRGLGIYEVSPPLDLNDQTSKTAALIIYNYIFQDIP